MNNIGATKRRPGAYATFDFTSAARGLTPGTRRMALIGTIATGGTLVPNVPTQVFSVSESDALAGRGSILALMARKAINTFTAAGSSEVQLWLCGKADPAGTAAAWTLTASGTATAGGDVLFKIAGRPLRASVTTGDTAATVAAAINSAIAANLADLPVTSTVAAAVCTATTRVTGVNGNDVKVTVTSAPAGITVTPVQSVTGAGVVDITTALDALASRQYQSIAIENHTAADVTDLDAYLDVAWSSSIKLYSHAFIGETGTVGTMTTLSAGANDHRINLTGYEQSPSLPGEVASAIGAARLTVESPSRNYDGHEIDLYPPTDAFVYADTEIETLLAAGVTPIMPKTNGKSEIVRLVTTKTTESSSPFENLLDLSNSYTTSYYAKLIDGALGLAIAGQSLNENLLKFLRDRVIEILRLGELAGDLHKVEDLLDQVQVTAHISVPSRAVAQVPIAPVPNAHQVDATYIMFIEAAG